MRDIWFADNRDLVKWSVLFHLAEQYDAKRIIQIAYYRPSFFDKVSIDEKDVSIPNDVTGFFRDIQNIKQMRSKVKVDVFDSPFGKDRNAYHNEAIEFIQRFNQDRCIVFLDPDTGLESKNPKFEHVLNREAKMVFNALKPADVLVFYQHQTNRNGSPWIDEKKNQLAGALELPKSQIKIASGRKIANDVVFYYTSR